MVKRLSEWSRGLRDNHDWFSIRGEVRTHFFWSDEWVGGATLKRRIDRFYSLSLCKEPSISDMRKKVENTWVWDLNWSRELYGHNVGGVKRQL